MSEEARNKEACCLVMGDTLKKDFPLIMVIGREPNYHCNVIDEVDSYPSPDGSKFWARSHELVTRYTNLKPHEFKAFCTDNDASPIVFCDASPLGLDSRYDGQKAKMRKALTGDALEAHANNVFSQQEIINRTSLVLISGLAGSGLDHAIPFVEKQCDTLGLPYAHIAYLVARTKNHTQPIRMQQITEAIPSGEDIIKACTDSFLNGQLPIAA